MFVFLFHLCLTLFSDLLSWRLRGITIKVFLSASEMSFVQRITWLSCHKTIFMLIIFKVFSQSIKRLLSRCKLSAHTILVKERLLLHPFFRLVPIFSRLMSHPLLDHFYSLIGIIFYLGRMYLKVLSGGRNLSRVFLLLYILLGSSLMTVVSLMMDADVLF